MSNFSAFMKKNKIEKENIKKAVTKSLCDENGKPLEWELRPVTTKENERFREACTREVPVKGKPGQYKPTVDMAAYQSMLMTAAVVYPDLNDKELQDSYGTMCAADLLKEMVDSPAEYTDLMLTVQRLSGFETLQEEVDEAKN